MYVKSRNLSRVLCGLTLGVGKVGGDGDYSVAYLFAKIIFRFGLKLLEHHCGNFLRSVLLSVDIHLVIAAHMALDGDNCSVGIGDSLILGKLTDKTLTVLGEGNYGGCCSVALGVGNNGRLAAFNYRYAGVGGTQVDSYNFSHNKSFPFFVLSVSDIIYFSVFR